MVDGLCAGVGNGVGAVVSELADDWCKAFVRDWQQAWNEHNLEKILSFYEEGFAMTSPVFQEVLGAAGMSCFGKPELRRFCETVFSGVPEYSIKVMAVAVGIGSVTVHYLDSSSRLIAETMQFSARHKIANAAAQC